MKKILFIVPSLKTGGTNSSLSNIFLFLRSKYNISVFSLSNERNASFSFDKSLIDTSPFLTLFERSLIEAKGIDKILPFVIKLTIKTCSICGLDLRGIIYKYYVHRLQKVSDYDYVVGFQEGSATKFASYFENAKKYCWIHCDYRYYTNKYSELSIYSKFHKIICVSEYTSKVFATIYPSLHSSTTFIYNLLDSEKILSDSCMKIDDECFNTNKITIISVGRIVPIKRYDLIPEIASRIKGNGISFSWYVLGPKSSEDYYEKINQYIKSYNVSDSVFLLGNKQNPYPYIKESDIFVCLSESEACPMVFCEAFTLGTPVITTNFGSSFEFLQSGYNGYVCEIDDVYKILIDITKNVEKVDSLKDNLKSYKSYNDEIRKKLLELFN